MIEFKPIVKQFEGCSRVVTRTDIQACRAYIDPAAKWRGGWCNFTDLSPKKGAPTEKRFINALKKSKEKPVIPGRPVCTHIIGKNKGKGKKRYIC